MTNVVLFAFGLGWILGLVIMHWCWRYALRQAASELSDHHLGKWALEIRTRISVSG